MSPYITRKPEERKERMPTLSPYPARSIKMRRRQPDNRIHKHELGSFTSGGKRFVVNLRPGVPRNACIEEFRDGTLRCWASHTWLDDSAANYVRDNATFNSERNSFVWNEGVKVSETRRG